MQSKEKGWRDQRNEWRNEIDRLQDEIMKQQKLLSVNLSNTPQTQTEAFMQHEIVKITAEYLVSYFISVLIIIRFFFFI